MSVCCVYLPACMSFCRKDNAIPFYFNLFTKISMNLIK